jgi:hypothetical protein
MSISSGKQNSEVAVQNSSTTTMYNTHANTATAHIIGSLVWSPWEQFMYVNNLPFTRNYHSKLTVNQHTTLNHDSATLYYIPHKYLFIYNLTTLSASHITVPIATDGVTDEWKKLSGEGFRNFYFSKNIIRAIKSRRIR